MREERGGRETFGLDVGYWMARPMVVCAMLFGVLFQTTGQDKTREEKRDGGSGGS